MGSGSERAARRLLGDLARSVSVDVYWPAVRRTLARELGQLSWVAIVVARKRQSWSARLLVAISLARSLRSIQSSLRVQRPVEPHHDADSSNPLRRHIATRKGDWHYGGAGATGARIAHVFTGLRLTPDERQELLAWSNPSWNPRPSSSWQPIVDRLAERVGMDGADIVVVDSGPVVAATHRTLDGAMTVAISSTLIVAVFRSIKYWIAYQEPASRMWYEALGFWRGSRVPQAELILKDLATLYHKCAEHGSPAGNRIYLQDHGVWLQQILFEATLEFILSHELGHVVLGADQERFELATELEIDGWAITRMLPSERSCQEQLSELREATAALQRRLNPRLHGFLRTPDIGATPIVVQAAALALLVQSEVAGCPATDEVAERLRRLGDAFGDETVTRGLVEDLRSDETLTGFFFARPWDGLARS